MLSNCIRKIGQALLVSIHDKPIFPYSLCQNDVRIILLTYSKNVSKLVLRASGARLETFILTWLHISPSTSLSVSSQCVPPPSHRSCAAGNFLQKNPVLTSLPHPGVEPDTSCSEFTIAYPRLMRLSIMMIKSEASSSRRS